MIVYSIDLQLNDQGTGERVLLRQLFCDLSVTFTVTDWPSQGGFEITVFGSMDDLNEVRRRIFPDLVDRDLILSIPAPIITDDDIIYSTAGTLDTITKFSELLPLPRRAVERFKLTDLALAFDERDIPFWVEDEQLVIPVPGSDGQHPVLRVSRFSSTYVPSHHGWWQMYISGCDDLDDELVLSTPMSATSQRDFDAISAVVRCWLSDNRLTTSPAVARYLAKVEW